MQLLVVDAENSGCWTAVFVLAKFGNCSATIGKSEPI